MGSRAWAGLWYTVAKPHLGSAAAAPSGSNTLQCAHSGPRRTQGTRCHSDNRFCRRLCEDRQAEATRVCEGPAAASTLSTERPWPDLSCCNPAGSSSPRPRLRALLGGHSPSLGFFSSAVKRTAPPGRSGWGKG